MYVDPKGTLLQPNVLLKNATDKSLLNSAKLNESKKGLLLPSEEPGKENNKSDETLLETLSNLDLSKVESDELENYFSLPEYIHGIEKENQLENTSIRLVVKAYETIENEQDRNKIIDKILEIQQKIKNITSETKPSNTISPNPESSITLEYFINKGFEVYKASAPNFEYNVLKSIDNNIKSSSKPRDLGFIPTDTLIFKGILATVQERSIELKRLKDLTTKLEEDIRSMCTPKIKINKNKINDRDKFIGAKNTIVEKPHILYLLYALKIHEISTYDELPTNQEAYNLETYINKLERPTSNPDNIKNAIEWDIKFNKNETNRKNLERIFDKFKMRAFRDPENGKIDDDLKASDFKGGEKDLNKFLKFTNLLSQPSITEQAIENIVKINTNRSHGRFLCEFFRLPTLATSSQRHYKKLKSQYKSPSPSR